MSEENVEIVRHGLELFNRGELDTLLEEVIHPEIDLRPGISVLGVGTVHGKDAVRRFWVEELPQGLDEFKVEAEGFEDLGDTVLAASHYRARGPGSGMAIEQTFFTLYRVEEGRIKSIRDYMGRAEALEAAGLSE